MRDVRLNGRYMPLESQPREGVSQVSVQGLSLGCSSDSCKRNQCDPPFTCVDLWRVHECRYAHQAARTKHSCTGEHVHAWLFHKHTHHFDKKAWRRVYLKQLTLKPFFSFWIRYYSWQTEYMRSERKGITEYYLVYLLMPYITSLIDRTNNRSHHR